VIRDLVVLLAATAGLSLTGWLYARATCTCGHHRTHIHRGGPR
jgi:hypothetical protein